MCEIGAVLYILLLVTIIHGYTKEDTYGSRDQAARFI